MYSGHCIFAKLKLPDLKSKEYSGCGTKRKAELEKHQLNSGVYTSSSRLIELANLKSPTPGFAVLNKEVNSSNN